MRVTNKIFNKEKKLSPLPVKELSYSGYLKKLRSIGDNDNLRDVRKDAHGTCVAGTCIYNKDFKNPFIFIYKYLPVHCKIDTLFHEIGHYYCSKNDCACLDNDILNEVHANEFAIQMLIDKQYYLSIGMWMANVVEMSKDDQEKDQKVYKILLKKPIWKKCIQILKNIGHENWVKLLLKELNSKKGE